MKKKDREQRVPEMRPAKLGKETSENARGIREGSGGGESHGRAHRALSEGI